MSKLAIDIGGTKIALAVFENGRIVERTQRPTNRELGPSGALPEIISIARQWPGFDTCGVGFGGPVNFDTQRVARSTHAAGWDGFPLRDHLQDALGVPTIIDNDANVGALGEATFGAGRGHLPLFYMTVSTGIGGGLILPDGADGSVYRGANSWACEIGHLTIQPDGPPCLCGARGCLERMCCGLWLERDHGQPPQRLFEDPVFVKRYVVDLTLGIKAALMLLNPARVVIGGGISQAGDRLFIPLREELARQWPDWSAARTEVAQAALGGDSVLWGALALAGTIRTS